jgi:FMN phosphatase YigB (HAD superfamily)
LSTANNSVPTLQGTLCPQYKEPVNHVWENIRALLEESYQAFKQSLKTLRALNLETAKVSIVTNVVQWLKVISF